MKVFLQALKDQITKVLESIRRIVQSKTVLSAAAGLMIHVAVKRQWLPETLVTQGLEAMSYILCAIFRVNAITDIRTGEQLK